MPMLRDQIGRPIWPQQLAVVARRTVTLEEIAAQANVNQAQAGVLVHALADAGYLQLLIAPQCPHCGFSWGAYEDEEQIPETTSCLVCHQDFYTEDADMGLAYEVIKTPEGW